MNTQKIAAIDIGSNSIKLAVAEASASDSFTVTFRDRDVVRLGQETLRERRLSAAAIERAANSIGRFRGLAENRGVTTIIAVATASVREAENAAEFIETVEAKTGVRVEVLSPVEEARLIGISVAALCGNTKESLLNIDIGGGSTELSFMRHGEPEQLFSMKIGAVGLTERFLKNDPPTTKELKDLRNYIRLTLERPTRELAEAKAQWSFATGTSGTSLALGRAVNETAESSEIALKSLADFNALVARMNFTERQQIPMLSAQRAEIIIAGGQILEGTMRALKIKTLQPCEFALREGAIIDYLNRLEAEEMPPVPDVADKRLRGVFAVGRRFGYEENHSLQVAAIAEKVFDALVPIYDLPRHDRTLLSAAALLHNVGYHIAHASHHKHSLYLIKHSELTGFSESERNVIAHVARYHRGSLPKEKHTDFTALSETEQKTVWRLGAILRLANALDRSYCSHVQDIKLTRNGGDLLVEVLSDVDCENELEAAGQRADMFETAFGCRLVFVRRPFAAKV
jgi:exopolyphosphatase/guanosine-5'-triphosphate,3'-diphosphate pyrophosphatase